MTAQTRNRPIWFRWTVLVLLGAWAAAWFFVVRHQGAYSWHYFHDSSTYLFTSGGDGLHLYAQHPEMQFGPVTVILAGLIGLVGGGVLPAQLAMLTLGIGIAVLIRLLAISERPDWSLQDINASLIIGVCAATPAWMVLAVGVGHLDDALALFLMLTGLVALRHDHALAAGILLSMSAVAKPWALPFVLLLLLIPGRRRWYSVAAYVTTQLVFWLPFIAADTRTLHVTGFKIPVQTGSVLAMLGMHGGTPSWDRPAQVILGLVLGWLVIRRRRWSALPLVVVLARVVLDPGAHTYYAAAVLIAALIYDVVGSPHRWPLWTIASALLVFALPQFPITDNLRGLGIVAVTVAAGALLCFRPIRSSEGHTVGAAVINSGITRNP